MLSNEHYDELSELADGASYQDNLPGNLETTLSGNDSVTAGHPDHQRQLRWATLPLGQAILVLGAGLGTFGYINGLVYASLIVAIAFALTLTSNSVIAANRNLLVDERWFQLLTWSRTLAPTLIAGMLPWAVSRDVALGIPMAEAVGLRLGLLACSIAISVFFACNAITTLKMLFTMGHAAPDAAH